MCSKWSWLRGQKPEQDNEKEGQEGSHKAPTVGWRPGARRGLACLLPWLPSTITVNGLPGGAR